MRMLTRRKVFFAFLLVFVVVGVENIKAQIVSLPSIGVTLSSGISSSTVTILGGGQEVPVGVHTPLAAFALNIPFPLTIQSVTLALDPVHANNVKVSFASGFQTGFLSTGETIGVNGNWPVTVFNGPFTATTTLQPPENWVPVGVVIYGDLASTTYSGPLVKFVGCNATSVVTASVNCSGVLPLAGQNYNVVKFRIGDLSQTNANLRVRSTPSLIGAIRTTQLPGRLGKIIGGPISASGYTWWNVSYDLGAGGWSVENYLNRLTTSTTYYSPGPDTTPPQVTILYPTSNGYASTTQSVISLIAYIKDNVAIATTTDGRGPAWQNITNGATGSVVGTPFGWAGQNIPLSPGNNVIVFTAQDYSGNKGTDAITITYIPRAVGENTNSSDQSLASLLETLQRAVQKLQELVK